ncbi:hypothetical protein GM418_15250 [Maribellus comscasis]|uniref:Arylsulfotransferase N-terminal domain-containing protein n=1 Tax=Maribellus comscasis TaxID=2681766 RepID=A0A6I6JV73_9BACT|nr:aryl-sulfate sulfotransferase [Maribellus comscasis]QGY44978.1 hypothetical protein GM418_15250 [Maribellus comscasis]
MITKRNKLLNILFAVVLAVLFSCSENQQLTFSVAPVIKNNPNESVPLTAYLDFETPQDYDSVFISLDEDGQISELCYRKEEKKETGYLLMLMTANKKLKIDFRLKDKNGKEYYSNKELSFKTPALPADDKLFPKIEITKNLKKSNDELILFNPRRRLPIAQEGSNRFNQIFGMLVIINQSGEVLWYYQTNSRISDFDRLPDGNISYITQDNRIAVIDLAGNIINEWYAVNRPQKGETDAIPVEAQTFHHDVSFLPNGNRLVLSTEAREIDNYYTSEADKNAPRKKQKVIGDVVVEFNPEGKVVYSWSAFDKMPVWRIGYETFNDYWARRGYPGSVDWSHANAVIPLPGEDAFLVNFRHQSAMIKVNKSTGNIDWIFAEPSGWNKELEDKLLEIPKDGWNWHQHSPRFTENGNLLFFNNNNFKARPFKETSPIKDCPSYIVEYKINEKDKTVEKVWSTENDGEDLVFSIAMGRVSELPETGNILACYGALLDSNYFDQMTWWNRGKFRQWTMVREYTHTEKPKVVWEMQLHPLTSDSKVGWTLFGAECIEITNVNKSNM